MDEDLIKSQTSFGFHLDGESEIDATLLSNMIRDVAELTKAAAKEECPDAYLKMNVTAFRNGSFQIDFSTVCAVARTMLISATAVSGLALSIVGTVKGFLEIKKLLKGENAKSIASIGRDKIQIENNKGQKIKVNKSSGAIINNFQIDQLVLKISNAVQTHNDKGGFTFSTPEGDTSYSANDLKDISKPMPINEEVICKKSVIKVDLPIKKADLTGHSAWEFRYKDHNITATIDDEKLVEDVNSGEVSIRAGDYISATLEIYVDLDSIGKPILGSEKYAVLQADNGIKHKLDQTTFG